MWQGTTALIPGINQHSLESHIANTSSLPTGSRKTIKDCGYDQKCPDIPATMSDKTHKSHCQNSQRTAVFLATHCAFRMLVRNPPITSGNVSSAQDNEIKNQNLPYLREVVLL